MNPPKEEMSRILLGSSFQNFAHSYTRDFLPASEDQDGNLSSGMASPLPRSIRSRVSKKEREREREEKGRRTDVEGQTKANFRFNRLESNSPNAEALLGHL